MPSTRAALAAIALVATACVAGGDSAGTGLDGEWVLSGSQPSLDAPADARIDLTVRTDGDTTTVRGIAACNSYEGTVEIGVAGGWRSQGYARTEMGCDQPLMAAEQAYLDVLSAIDSWSLVDAEHLLLQGPDGELAFDAVAPPG